MSDFMYVYTFLYETYIKIYYDKLYFINIYQVFLITQKAFSRKSAFYEVLLSARCQPRKSDPYHTAFPSFSPTAPGER